MLHFCAVLDRIDGPTGGVVTTPGDHFTTVTLLGGTTMPQEPNCAPKLDQPVRILPDRPLSRTQMYRRRRIARELGVPLDQIPDRRGHHANHPKGKECRRWNVESRMISEHGYVKIRVGVDHPLADPNGYAYEHLLVWAAAGRELPDPGQIIHHENEDKTDNRLSNLELISRVDHGILHASAVPDSVVLEIRESYAAGIEDMPGLAKRFGLPVARVSKYIRGESRCRAGGPISTENRGKQAAGRLLDGRAWDEFPTKAEVSHA